MSASRPASADRVERVTAGAGSAPWRRVYHLDGRLLAEQDPCGTTLRFDYDAHRFLTAVTADDGRRVEYEIGERSWRARTADCETTITISADGLPERIETVVRGVRAVVAYDHERGGCLYPGAPDWLRLDERELRCSDTRYLTVEPRADGVDVTFSTGVRQSETLATAGGRPLATRVGDALDIQLAYDDKGRVTTGGARYDDKGRLTHYGDRAYRYDTPDVAYDAAGRETGRYGYDLFGRLDRVELPGGRVVRYLHDGFGRLVGRECDGELTVYALGIDGKRLAELDATGHVTASYLWLGTHCAGRVDGPLGGPLSATFHRVPGTLKAAVGDARGTLTTLAAQDAYGSDWPIEHRTPGFAGLFGDPETGLLHAGTRWLDPARGRFISPDSWHGEDGARRFPSELNKLLARLPGGLTTRQDAVEAYAWCGYDPINNVDVNGHNWFGLIFSSLSALLWEIGLTTISLDMEILNIAFWLLTFWGPALSGAGGKFFHDYAIYNLAAPTASYFQKVPLALPLNGVLRLHDRGWTLGSVIWVRGDKWRTVEATSKRGLLVCANAATYAASSDAFAAGSTFRIRNAAAHLSATVAAGGAQLTGATPAANVVLRSGDWVALRATGATTDEVRQVTSAAAATIDLAAPPLPAALAGQTVDVTRLDDAYARVVRDTRTVSRRLTFIRGDRVHLARTLPDSFDAPLDVTEHLPESERKATTGSLPNDRVTLRLHAAGDRTGYAANDDIRVLSRGTYAGRHVTATPGTTDLRVDAALPPGDTGIELVKLQVDGTPAAAQTAAGTRVRAGTLTGLEAHDVLRIEAGGTPILRAVSAVKLEIAVAALPTTVHSNPLTVEMLAPADSDAARGVVDTATQITTTAAPPASLANQPVRITPATGAAVVSVVSAVDVPNKRLTLRDAITLTATTGVTVRALRPVGSSARYDAEAVTPPADKVAVTIPRATAIRDGDAVRVRLRTATDGGEVRLVAGAPTVLAEVDTAVPATHVSALTVTRLTAVASLRRTGATVPDVRLRLDVVGTNPYVAGERLRVSGGSPEEEAIVEIAAVSGTVATFAEPVPDGLTIPTSGVAAFRVAATSGHTAAAGLDEGMVLIPSAMDAEPVTRRRAFELHEMRHVLQGAWWGPMLLSLPIPWLIDLGYSIGSNAPGANSASKVLRHISVGGLDSLVALGIWGAGGSPGPQRITATIKDATRKVVTVGHDTPAATREKLSDGTRMEVMRAGEDSGTYAVVDKLQGDDVVLRFALEDSRFQPGEPVALSVSPFEQVRKRVSDISNLNLMALWQDHIPTGWGRVLNRVSNRDSWFPGLGLYPLSLLIAGFNENRLPNEQDAAFHSGDLYSSIPLTTKKRVFVGEFTRVFAFLHPRKGAEDARQGLSDLGALNLLSIEPPATGGITAADVAGGVPAPSTGQIAFRENYYLPMNKRVENVVGALFSASKAGNYQVRAKDDLAPDESVIFKFAFQVSFLKERTVEVADITLTPSPAQDIFETEVVPFTVAGDATAEYRLRFPAGGAAPTGAVDGLRYKAPLLPAAATQVVEVTASYRADHPVFSGPGQEGPIALTEAQRTNLCTSVTLNLKPITAPTLAFVNAGGTREFDVPFEPVRATVGTLPAGVTGTPRLITGRGRPCRMTFVAPPRVASTVVIPFELVFGADPATRKTLPLTIEVRP